jgi:hypothetical protein
MPTGEVRSRVVIAIIVLLMSLPWSSSAALAHDDPILTVRILASGLTNGQIDAAMGEVDDNAMILVDRPVVGRQQVQAWMEDQLRQNLRIEVVDIQPTQLADGYSVTWTTRMYREDWRRAGVSVRSTTEQSTIHNGRVTRWTSSLASELAPDVSLHAPSAVAPASQPLSALHVAGVPLSDIPVMFFVLLAVLLIAGGGLSVRVLRGPRHDRGERKPVIEALRQGTPEGKR